MKIIGTGLLGLVGSRILELLDKHQFQNISRQNGVDIQVKEQVFDAIGNSSANTVLHLAAFTKVDDAEEEKDLGEQSEAWKINVFGTQNVLEACEKYNKKLVYFSSDMVFPGTKEPPDKYLEDDETGAVGFYAKTKEEAEKLIEKASCPWLILRIGYPYRANFEKKDYVRVLKELLESGKPINAVSDHYFTPTFIDDIASVLELIFKENLTGKLHVVGGEIVTPHDVAIKIAKAFNLDLNLIGKTTRNSYFKDKAPRAYNLSLNNDKIEKLGIQMTSFSEGLEKIKTQINY
jgi:dTDP-4-dehydrorhamnose reductase